MSFSPFPGPIAPENNPAIMPQYYQPSRFVISAISLGQTTTITTSVDHNYVIGQQVRIIIPPTYGTRELNEQDPYVIAIPSANQVTVNVVSQNYFPFIASPAYGPTPPAILAIGDINTGIISTTGRAQANNNNALTSIPGTFINISPAT